MIQGSRLREYRKARKVGQEELAVELGRRFASTVCRMERRELTDLEFAEAIAAIERIGDRRQRAASPERAMQKAGVA